MKRPRTASDWVTVLSGLGALVFLLVVGIVLLSNGISQHKTPSIVGGAFMTAVGGILPAFLLFLGLQQAARGAVPGLKPPKITMTVDQSAFTPGATVAGRVDVVEAGHVRKLEVSLVCHDRTSDYEGVSYRGAASVLAEGELAPPASYAFSITLPPDAPVTYSGDSARIWWVVDARCDVLGSDEHVSQEVSVRVPAQRAPV